MLCLYIYVLPQVLLGADFPDCHALAARVLPVLCADDGTVTLQRCFSWLEREGESLLATAAAAEPDTHTVSDDSSSADAAATTGATAGAATAGAATAGGGATVDDTASTQSAEQQQEDAVRQRIADAYAEINADSDSIADDDVEALLKLLGVEDASSAAEGLRSADGTPLRKHTFEGWYMILQNRQQQQVSSAGSSVNSSFAESEQQQLSREGSAAGSSADADTVNNDADTTSTTATAAAAAADSSTAEPSSSAATTAGFLSPTRNKTSSGGSSGFQFNAPPFSPPPRTPARAVPAAVPAVLASPGFSFGAGSEELRQVATAPWVGEDAISEDEDSGDEEEEA
jgi:hypothetical protein